MNSVIVEAGAEYCEPHCLHQSPLDKNVWTFGGISGKGSGNTQSHNWFIAAVVGKQGTLWTAIFDGIYHAEDACVSLSTDSKGNFVAFGYATMNKGLHEVVCLKYSPEGIPLDTAIWFSIGHAEPISVVTQGNIAFITVSKEALRGGRDAAMIRFNMDSMEFEQVTEYNYGVNKWTIPVNSVWANGLVYTLSLTSVEIPSPKSYLFNAFTKKCSLVWDENIGYQGYETVPTCLSAFGEKIVASGYVTIPNDTDTYSVIYHISNTDSFNTLPLNETGKSGFILYPNPTNLNVNLQLYLARDEHVEAKLTDILGREVKTLLNEHLERGSHRFKIPVEYASGVYFCSIRTTDLQETKKLVIIK
jgi:hypothetical protein